MSNNCIYLKQKLDRTIYCKKQNKTITFKNCSGCEHKEYKNSTESSQKKMQRFAIKGKKHKLTKATDIPTALKKKVWERDKHRCIFCGTIVQWDLANSHFIKRSQLGLGIEQNIMTNCEQCHELFERSPKRKQMKEQAKQYFMSLYPSWNEKKLVYKKYQGGNNK